MAKALTRFQKEDWSRRFATIRVFPPEADIIEMEWMIKDTRTYEEIMDLLHEFYDGEECNFYVRIEEPLVEQEAD